MLEWIVNMDIAVLLFIQEHLRTPALTAFFRGITFLGNGGWFWIVLGIILLFFKETRKSGITVLLVLAVGALFTNVVLKNLVARVRPYDLTDLIVPLIQKPKDYSFPSGHTCASFSAAIACYRTLPGSRGRQWGKVLLVLAALIAFSRLYLGVHYPTDVIGGILIAILANVIVFSIERKYFSSVF